MRYLADSFWTPARDTRLQKLEAAGLSAAQIAGQVGTTRNAVLGRSARLRGVVYRYYVQREKELRAQAAARRLEMKRRSDVLLSEMHEAIAKRVPRTVAIAKAVEGGATYRAIGDELGLSRQRVHQIVSRG
jgi:hypothetical protein